MKAIPTPEQEATAFNNTKVQLAKVLAMSREIGLPDAEVGRVLDLYTANLESILYQDEMCELMRREDLIQTLRARGARAPGIDRGTSRQQSPTHGPVGDWVPAHPPSADGLELLSLEDLQSLLARTEVVKPLKPV